MQQVNYYAQNLNSQNLYNVYDTNILRVKQYLREEIRFVQKQLLGTEKVLELGAGYGRILKELSPYAKFLLGLDISKDSVEFGRKYLEGFANVDLEVSDAHELTFEEEFNVVLCLQNALSALKGDPLAIVNRCMKALLSGGKAYFSTYSNNFWDYRLAWFEEQVKKGLLGEIDTAQTKEGVIVCKDGFRAISFTKGDLAQLGKDSGYEYEIHEVDVSSFFLIINKA